MARTEFWKRLEASSRSLQDAFGRETLPDTVVVLGSGFKGFEGRLTGTKMVDLSDVDHMPVPTVEGHGAALALGEVAGRELLVLTGRVHLYEGCSASEVVYPLRVLSTLGVQRVLLTNAAGSVDPGLRPGSVVALKDQINLTGTSCLAGPEARELGPVFIDMGECYDSDWREALMRLEGVTTGVYAGVLGPAYETPSETAMLHRLGANVVGMSTVQETLAARQLRMRVACLSFVTNMAGGLGDKLSHAEVLELVGKYKPMLQDLLTRAVGVV